jgi:hypothetical protein
MQPAHGLTKRALHNIPLGINARAKGVIITIGTSIPTQISRTDVTENTQITTIA